MPVHYAVLISKMKQIYISNFLQETHGYIPSKISSSAEDCDKTTTLHSQCLNHSLLRPKDFL